MDAEHDEHIGEDTDDVEHQDDGEHHVESGPVASQVKSDGQTDVESQAINCRQVGRLFSHVKFGFYYLKAGRLPDPFSPPAGWLSG